MVFDRSLVPTQLAKGPAVGFLVLTTSITELRLSSCRLGLDWSRVDHALQELNTALNEFLAGEDQDHELALEFIIHRDRVQHVLDCWESGAVHSVERAVLANQERYVRERQRAAREAGLKDGERVVEKR